jgi:hypothetical protein
MAVLSIRRSSHEFLYIGGRRHLRPPEQFAPRFIGKAVEN